MNRLNIFFSSVVLLLATLPVHAGDGVVSRLQATRVNPIMQFQKSQASGMLSFRNSDKTAPSGLHRVSDYNKKGEIVDAESYGTIDGDDGSVWIYTIKTTESPTHPYSYGSATIELYDNNSTKVTTVTINVPDSLNINAIEPFGTISSKFYDTDSKTKEFTVYLHEVGENYTSIGHFMVYNLNGELVRQYDNLGNIIWFDATEKYDTYQRAIFVTAGTDSLGNSTTRMAIMKPAAWNSKEPQEEHVFEVRDDLIEYSNGPCLNTYKIDGKPYYMLSYYEKPFTSGYDENYEIILTENNNYIVEVYDKDYNQISSFSIPVVHPEDVYCSEYTCGLYSYNDLTKGYYTGNDNFNIVVTRMDVRLDTDDDTYPYAFLVYDQDGSLVNTIAENVISWKQMTSIRGVSDQVGCICLNDGVETLEMVNVPSCETATVFQAETEGRKISSNYDRYPVQSSQEGTGEAYEYVIGMGDSEASEISEVISSIGWFHQDGTLDHYVRFNLGFEGEYFTPLIESYTLDPSLVNANSAHEYIYIAKIRSSMTSTVENVLVIADQDGNEIKRFAGGDEKTLRIVGIADVEIGKPRLILGFSDNSLGSYSLDFYTLPFVKFSAGGDGSLSNPYIITSAGDLKQIASEPTANYVLGSDIDMSEISDPWSPISQFSGTLDGKGYTVSNLYINGDDSYSGLFGYFVNEGSYVRNITFSDPLVMVNNGNRYVGLISGMSMRTSLDSIFVINPVFMGEGNAEVGGLVGQATYYTTFRTDYVKNATMNLPACSAVGGIAGDTRTSTTVDASYFGGSITAQNTVGGIVGTTGRESTVKNCHVDASLTAENTIGGVIGAASRSEVSNNFVEGTIQATKTDMYGNASAGGLLGSLESLWSGKATVIVKGNVVAATSITVPDSAKAVHRIVGFTIADEQYEEGEKHKSEAGLSDNYAIPSLTASEQGATLPDGSDVPVIDNNFLTGIGFQYGTDYTAPWKGDKYPSLYFETEEPSPVRGDVNGDGVVDIADVNAVLTVIFDSSEYSLVADVNADGVVDIADVNAVLTIMFKD